jgi:hypothetical protein
VRASSFHSTIPDITPWDCCFIPLLHSYPYYRNDCTTNTRPLCMHMSMGFSCQFRPLFYDNASDQLNPASLKTEFRDRRAQGTVWVSRLEAVPVLVPNHDHRPSGIAPSSQQETFQLENIKLTMITLIYVFFPHNQDQVRVRSGFSLSSRPGESYANPNSDPNSTPHTSSYIMQELSTVPSSKKHTS